MPPYLRVIERSPWLNGWKIASRWSSGMPMPVSRTAKRTVAFALSSCSTRSDTTTSPWWVNFTALPIRLVSTCRSRVGSPRTCSGTPAGTSASSSMRCSRAFTPIRLTVESTSRGRSNGTASICRLSASILERSRMSLMRVSSVSPAAWIRLSERRWSVVSSVSSSSSARPSTAFIGVRISWLMLARNELRIFATRSAVSFASWSAARERSCSSRIDAVS